MNTLSRQPIFPMMSPGHSTCSPNILGYERYLENLSKEERNQTLTQRNQPLQQPLKPYTKTRFPETVPIGNGPSTSTIPPSLNNNRPITSSTPGQNGEPTIVEKTRSQRKRENKKRNKNRPKTPPLKPLEPKDIMVKHEEFWADSNESNRPSTSSASATPLTDDQQQVSITKAWESDEEGVDREKPPFELLDISAIVLHDNPQDITEEHPDNWEDTEGQSDFIDLADGPQGDPSTWTDSSDDEKELRNDTEEVELEEEGTEPEPKEDPEGSEHADRQTEFPDVEEQDPTTSDFIDLADGPQGDPSTWTDNSDDDGDPEPGDETEEPEPAEPKPVEEVKKILQLPSTTIPTSPRDPGYWPTQDLVDVSGDLDDEECFRKHVKKPDAPRESPPPEPQPVEEPMKETKEVSSESPVSTPSTSDDTASERAKQASSVNPWGTNPEEEKTPKPIHYIIAPRGAFPGLTLAPSLDTSWVTPTKPATAQPSEKSPWSTPIPTRHNLPPPAGPGSLWSPEASLGVAKVEEKVAEIEVRKQRPVNLEQFARFRYQEEQRNVFTPFYFEKKDRSKSQKCPKNFRHTDCISFAAMSHIWTGNWDKDLPALPRAAGLVIPLPDGIPSDDTVFAYYRVLAEKDQKYILIACHVNLHGYHRGDLRFIEVNCRTELAGFPGKNVIGNLFLGDILAVTELARNSSSRFTPMDASVSSVSQDTPCFWMASKIHLYPRYQTCPVTFTFLKNRMAVVKGDDEPMRVTVEDWDTVKPDLIYIGVCFKPEKLELNFTEDFGKSKKNLVASKASRIASYPNSFGTIYGYKECEDQNEHFSIGTNAFSDPELPPAKREKIVETCSLMGFSAANTIFNGRFDCRAFHMQDITKSNQTVRFRIDNPPNQPTLGLWNSGNRIMFGGPEGDVNASIETVIKESEESLRISARLSRDIPKGLDFRHGEYFVSQREVTDHYTLYDGYFQDLDKESNGRKIIETLYGGKPLELKKDPKEHMPQYYFPGVGALNEFQNEYVQMLLDGNPLIIGSSPFGCGKSMTIITGALEIYKRNCLNDVLANQRQQLLITQSNYASVNLIEIAKRIRASGDTSLSALRFVRFVTEKNWNELPDNCRTEYDMPYLMNRIFCEWATGRIDENDRRLKRLQNVHLNHMLAYILKNQLLQPTELGGSGRRVYDRSGDIKSPFAGLITEAFFILYQPDLIMTTADSSKNLLSVLKEVCTVQIDEASQLPEYTLLGLLKTFNKANFGLIGDIQQLPPYCEDTLDGKLKDFGIGNTMERAIKNRLFPTSILRYVYRCHPKTTSLLSELFYDRALISGVEEHQRNQFMHQRSDFWVNPQFPFMIVNNEGNSFKMGTSVGNESEKDLIGKMIQNLLHHNKYPVKPHDIGVISFYAAQTSILTEHLRGSGVKCGTVDAFQGTEREIIIVCCTNEHVSDFMQLSNRLNVALSRAKQATIIVGNVDGLRRARYWRTIVERVEKHRNLVNGRGWQAPASYVPHHITADHTAPVYPGARHQRKSRKYGNNNYENNRWSKENHQNHHMSQMNSHNQYVPQFSNRWESSHIHPQHRHN